MSDLLPMFPLSTVLFPHSLLPLHVFEPRYRVMTKECLEGDRRFGVVLISRGSEVGGGETRVSTGTVASIDRHSTMPDGRSMLVVRGTGRFRVTGWMTDDPYPKGTVEWLDEPVGPDLNERLVSARTAVRRARALLSELRDVPPPSMEEPDDERAASWWLCAQAPVSVLDRQRLLECDDAGERLGHLEKLADEVSDDLTRLLSSG